MLLNTNYGTPCIATACINRKSTLAVPSTEPVPRCSADRETYNVPSILVELRAVFVWLLGSSSS